MDASLNDALDDALAALFSRRGVLDPSGVAAGLGMSVSEALALRHLRSQSLSQGELASHLGLQKSTVSRLVDGLVAKGWVSRARPEDNGRVREISISPEGTAVVDEVALSMRTQHSSMLNQLTEAERNALRVALPALARVLRSTDS